MSVNGKTLFDIGKETTLRKYLFNDCTIALCGETQANKRAIRSTAGIEQSNILLSLLAPILLRISG